MIRIDNYEAKKIRTGNDNTDCGGVIQYGLRATATATGRARCRVCGEKIIKGEKEYVFPWDIGGCGSHTTTIVHIHAVGCEHNK